MKHLIITLVFAATLAAQSIIPIGGGKAAAIIGPRGDTLPESCVTGQVFQRTGATSPGLYNCVAGVWVQAGGGSADAVTGASSLTTANQVPFVSSSGVLAGLPSLYKSSSTSAVGIGPSNTSPTGTLHVYDATATTGATSLIVRAGASQGTTAPLSNEMVTNGTFDTDATGWTLGANWAHSGGAVAHSDGSTAALSQSLTVVGGTTYQISFTITGRTAGTVTVALGSVTLVSDGITTTFSATAARTLVASGSGSQSLTITPSSNFNGSIDNVSVRSVTGTIPSLFSWQNSSGSVVQEVRGDAALSNSAVGLNALGRNTTGSYNTASGADALLSNTTGNNNTASGADALRNNTTGGYNTASGADALRNNTTGGYNTASGYYALRNNTTGNNNTAVGRSAGDTETAANANTTGSNNVWIGTESGPGVITQLTNSIGVGYRSKTMASNHAVFGNANITLTTLYGLVEAGTSVKFGAGTEPTCDSTTRGIVVMVQGSAGVADTLRVCRKDAEDAYAWVSLF